MDAARWARTSSAAMWRRLAELDVDGDGKVLLAEQTRRH
jgi:hypothetical protein